MYRDTEGAFLLQMYMKFMSDNVIDLFLFIFSYLYILYISFFCGKASLIFPTKNIGVFGYKVVKHLTS